MENALYKAFTGSYSEMENYLNNTGPIIRQADFRDMLRQMYDNDLKAFTKAAMKGLCQAAGSVIIQHGGLTQQQEDAITYAAVELARATLSELSKQQQP